MYLKQNITRPAGNPGVGLNPRDAVVLIDVDDIAYMPTANDPGVVIENDIVLKEGRYPIHLYMTPGTAEISSSAEGDTDAVGFTPSLTFKHPGNSEEVREFKAWAINRRFIAILRYCTKQTADLIGSLCEPCKITPNYTGNNDGNANEFTVEQVVKGNDVYIYKGAIPAQDVVGAIAAAATSFDYAGDGMYQTSAGTGLISKINNGVNGAVVTILGCDGQAPEVGRAETGNIAVIGGKKFVATAGSQITLRCYDLGNDTMMWVETSRYENA